MGSNVCRAYKALFAFAFLGTLGTAAALGLDAWVVRKGSERGRFGRLERDVDEGIWDVNAPAELSGTGTRRGREEAEEGGEAEEETDRQLKSGKPKVPWRCIQVPMEIKRKKVDYTAPLQLFKYTIQQIFHESFDHRFAFGFVWPSPTSPSTLQTDQAFWVQRHLTCTK